ncbi:DUF3622 domain-containing protein [Neptuniibacter sp.]|uniref:DUF3622 domain-containing protein n=1 Tax=Neptuniibacter sp. TaxID=1962643 RepID=UPI00262471C6|nr:DUF3622 domain-containing protein [Neptuniibacter sp.]MCP4596877.1 DUF3622 domain-containing protein [Neptuniibacter sp.]
MSKGKKYSYQVAENDGSWSAEIVRQVSNRKTVISKRQDDFKTEADAQSWAEQELQQFLDQQVERNKRKAEKRELRAESDDVSGDSGF